MSDNQRFLLELITEAKSRSGGLVLSLDGQPQAVVLTIDRYNSLMAGGADSLTNKTMEIPQQKKQTVLVTGGAGYIGGHVVHSLLKRGYTPIVIDDFRTGKRDHIPAGVTVVEGNVSNLELLSKVFHEYSVDAVIHLAALLEVEESVRKPFEYFENNAAATYILLQAMEQAGVKRIIFSSTAAVYGEQATIPIPENAVPQPNNPYGESKLLPESILKYFCAHLGFNATVLRYFNVAGCEPTFNVVDTHKNSHLIPIVLDVAMGKANVLTVYGKDYPTFDGSCVRDFIHVLDVAEAHIASLEKDMSGFSLYNIGTGKGFSVEEVVQSAAEVTGKMIPIEVGPRRAGDAAITVADTTKIQRELGFKPQYSTLEHIIDTSWQMANRLGV